MPHVVICGAAADARHAGRLAWLAWLVLHLFTCSAGRNRVSTLMNLTYQYVFWGHGGAVIVGDEPGSLRQPAVDLSSPQ